MNQFKQMTTSASLEGTENNCPTKKTSATIGNLEVDF